MGINYSNHRQGIKTLPEIFTQGYNQRGYNQIDRNKDKEDFKV